MTTSFTPSSDSSIVNWPALQAQRSKVERLNCVYFIKCAAALTNWSDSPLCGRYEYSGKRFQFTHCVCRFTVGLPKTKTKKKRFIFAVEPSACSRFLFSFLFICFVWAKLNTVGIFIIININKDTGAHAKSAHTKACEGYGAIVKTVYCSQRQQ